MSEFSVTQSGPFYPVGHTILSYMVIGYVFFYLIDGCRDFFSSGKRYHSSNGSKYLSDLDKLPFIFFSFPCTGHK